MRVGVVSNFFPPEVRGGAEIFARDLCEEMSRKGFDIQVFTSTSRRQKTERSGNLTVHYFRSVPPSVPPLGDVLGYNFNPWALRLVRALDATDCDIVHVHNINSSIMLYPLLTALRRPVVCHVHDHWPVCYRGVLYDTFNGKPCQSVRPSCCFNPSRRTIGLVNLAVRERLLRRFEETVARFIVPSQHMGEALVARGFTKKEKTSCIRLGIDLSRVPTGSRRSRQFVFAGRLVGYKNPGLVPEIVRRGRVPPDVLFRIFGRGPLEADLAARLRPAPRPRVVLGGYRNRSSILREMRASLGLLIPSLIPENSPLVTYEALACGTPVLCTDRGGAKELVADSAAGYVISPDDIPQWEESVVSLLDSETFSTLSQRALAYAKTHLDISHCGEAIARLYDEVV